MKHEFSLMPHAQLRNKMKKFTYVVLLLFSSLISANPSLTDQLNALDNAQNQAIANDNARAQAEYKAQLAEQRRLEQIAVEQREADRRVREKAIQAQAAANNAAAIRAQAAASKAAAEAKAANEERLQDKTRAQIQEDEEREYIKQQSALKIQQIELETQRLKAKADLELAIANDRIKSVAAETDIARKKEATEIDVIQSGADVDRTVAKGVESNLSGSGNEGLYKFLLVIALIILVLLVVIIAWWYFMRKKSKTNEPSQENVNTPSVNSENER